MSHDLQQPGTQQVHHGSKVEPLHLVALAPPQHGMRFCMQSSAGGLLPLLLLLLATEGTSSSEEAARSEESSELLEQDDFLVRSDAAGHTCSSMIETNVFPFVFMRLAAHHITSLAISAAANMDKYEELGKSDVGVSSLSIGCLWLVDGNIIIELYRTSRS